MASDGMIGNGSKVGYSASSPTTWIPLGQMLNVDGIEEVRAKVDRTIHSTGKYKRSLPGLIEVSDLTLDILADPDESATNGTVQSALRTLLHDGTTVYWRIEIPIDRTQSAYKPFEFQGYVQRWKLNTPIEGAQTFNVTVAFDDSSFYELYHGATAIS